MKLEDIELKLGDKLTFDDGGIAFEQNIEDTTDNWYYEEHLVKIERYEKCFQRIEDDIWVYELKTIWERKEEHTNNDIEELDIEREWGCDDGIFYINKKICAEDMKDIQNKLNEVIRKINEMNKESDK